MVRRQQADLENLFREALRKDIGDNRYQLWFAAGVRFLFEGDVLTVEVDEPFIADWIVGSGYVHTFEKIGVELFAAEIKVKVSLKESVGSSASISTPSALTRQPVAQVSSPALSNAPYDSPLLVQAVSTPEPPKRKRGRPRKNPPATTERPVQSAITVNAEPPQDALFNLPSTTADVLNAERRVPEWSSVPYAEPVQEPPKRKRGRPRKKPEPEPTNVQQPPLYPTAISTPSDAAPPSLFDVYQTAQRRHSLSAPESLYAAPGGVDLSESERVAWAVGDFGVNEQKETAPPRPSAFQFNVAPTTQEPEYQPPEPKRRGRPKGSTTRKPAEPKRDLLSIVAADDDEGVLRDERGFNVVTRPKEPARVRAEDRAVRFASLNTFIEGFSNRLARRVADVAITEPGAMSPIFICGPTSVGKTHLLEGICDAYTRLPNVKPPLYMTSEQFTSAFIQSLRGGGAFRERFRNISLFALDDVHFLEGKTSTQTELLNVVDFLRARRVQMVFSANRPLNELSKLRGELTTRIESGVVCKIDNPERETLARILRQMALERNMIVGEDVCRYVVSRFATHARQLSGALNRLLAAQLTTGMPITLELAHDALADLAAANVRNVKLEDVERVVLEIFGLESNALKSSSRAKRCADPRAVAMWLARKHTRFTLAEIGQYFSGRKHSAVLAAQKKVDGWISTNETLDAGSTAFSINDVIERAERALTYPR